jgi:hypothetical protein
VSREISKTDLAIGGFMVLASLYLISATKEFATVVALYFYTYNVVYKYTKRSPKMTSDAHTSQQCVVGVLSFTLLVVQDTVTSPYNEAIAQKGRAIHHLPTF